MRHHICPQSFCNFPHVLRAHGPHTYTKLPVLLSDTCLYLCHSNKRTILPLYWYVSSP